MTVVRVWEYARAGLMIGVPGGVLWGVLIGLGTYLAAQANPAETVFRWSDAWQPVLVGLLALGLPSVLIYAVLKARGKADKHTPIVSRAVFAGLAGGIVLGVGMRVAMRVMAILEGQTPAFGWPGTLGIVLVFGVMLGPVLGLVFAGVQQWVPVRGLWKGVLFSLIVMGVLIALRVAGPEVDAAGGLWPYALVMFSAVFVVFGLIIAVVTARVLPLDFVPRFGRKPVHPLSHD